MKYSPSTNGFYTPEIHGTGIPADAIEITTEQHAALMEGQASGQCITCDENGLPCLCDPPAPSTEALLEKCKVKAKQLLQETDWSQLGDVLIENKAAFDAYRSAVRAIYFNPVTEPVWPERPEATWL